MFEFDACLWFDVFIKKYKEEKFAKFSDLLQIIKCRTKNCSNLTMFLTRKVFFVVQAFYLLAGFKVSSSEGKKILKFLFLVKTRE